MKICNCCGEAKPLHRFGKYKGNKDGLKNICKNCVSKKASKYYIVFRQKKRS